MDTQDIFNPQRLQDIIGEFDKKLDGVLTQAYLNRGEECVIDVLKRYNLAIWKCYGNDIIAKIEKTLLENQELLIPVIKRYFAGEHFNVELDYIYFLLTQFSPNSVISLKDEWINYVLTYKYDYEYFIDMIDTLFKNKVLSNDQLKRMTEVEIERVAKAVERLRSVDVSDYIDFETYLKEYVHVSKEANQILYIKAYEEEWESWKEKYWDKDNAIRRLQSDERYFEELNCLLNKVKT